MPCATVATSRGDREGCRRTLCRPDVQQRRRANPLREVRDLPSPRRGRSDGADEFHARCGRGRARSRRASPSARCRRGRPIRASATTRTTPACRRSRSTRSPRGSTAGCRKAPAPAPAMPKYDDGGWRLVNGRPPDVILEMPTEYELPAEGQVPIFRVWDKNPFKEDVFIEALQIRPTNRAVTHHSALYGRKLPEGTTLQKTRRVAGRPGALVHPDLRGRQHRQRPERTGRQSEQQSPSERRGRNRATSPRGSTPSRATRCR